MGIGFACAELFREQGARIAITGRSEANLVAAKDALDEDVLTVCADVSRVDDIERMAGVVRNHFDGLDGLLVNAGVAAFKSYEETHRKLRLPGAQRLEAE